MRGDALNLLPTTTAVQRGSPALRSVEEVFHSGLLVDVIRAPSSQMNSRIDAFFDLFMDLPLFEPPIEISTWGRFGAEANYRRSVSEAFLGQTLQEARAFVASAPGRFLVRVLPFENRERQNDTHELLYFRDCGIHRRLIERTVTFDRGHHYRLDTDALEDLRTQQIESHVPKRWEAFVVTTIIDLVGDRCDAFAYRHKETREIDLVLEWNDRGFSERWAIEIASRKFNTHPSPYFAEECQYIGVRSENCYVVRRANECDGGARGRGGVPAISLPRMVDCLRQRMRR